MEQMTVVGLVIVAVAGLGIAAAYVVAGPTIRRILHGRGGGETVTGKPSA
jgi:hypothetical protein